MALTIGVDIGGTKIAAGVVDDAGRVLDWERVPTPRNGTDIAGSIADAVADAVERVRGPHDVVAVGVGAAGFIDEQRSTVLFAPNVVAWRNEPLKDHIEKRVRLPVFIENDANAAAWAEARFGAGCGQDHLVCVTVGTGIGGGLIVDGRLYRGRFGVAAEFGHLRVVPDGLPCGCGNRGCWEAYASGSALVRGARELAVSGVPSVRGLLERAGGRVDGITGPVVTSAAQEGDPVAVELFEGLGRWLGVGLASLAAVLDPGCFVIGGGVAEAGDLLLRPAKEEFRLRLTAREHRPEAVVRLAALGNEAGVVGAADLARQPE